MNNLRQAAQQALEALELDAYGEPPRYERNAAITALRAALAEPEGPCPTCVSLARAVMMDQMGSA